MTVAASASSGTNAIDALSGAPAPHPHEADRALETDHALERLVFFSDAVFAIVITLLVIDIHAPTLAYGRPDADYWRALGGIVPELVGFFISFFVVGSYWAAHHRMMAFARHYSPRLMQPNLLLLATIAAVPFFTAFASANPGMRVPVFCYCAWLFVAGLFSWRLQRVVTSPPVVDETVSADAIAATRERGAAVVLGTLTAAAVGLVLPPLGQISLTSIPLWRHALRRRASRHPACVPLEGGPSQPAGAGGTRAA